MGILGTIVSRPGAVPDAHSKIDNRLDIVQTIDISSSRITLNTGDPSLSLAITALDM